MTSDSPSIQRISLEPVLAEHGELDRLFLEHQAALMALDLASALGHLRSFEALLVRHMEFEEGVLIAAWREVGAQAERLGPDLLEDEHKKLLKRLGALMRAVGVLDEMANLRHHDVIQLFDEELRFKRLLHHHDERERLGLYPFLAEGLDKERAQAVRSQTKDYLGVE